MARTPKQILQSDYLIARAKVIEVAAMLDRIDRAVDSTIQVDNPSDFSKTESIYQDIAYQKIQAAIAILMDSDKEKTRRIQELLSRAYVADWMEQFKLPTN